MLPCSWLGKVKKHFSEMGLKQLAVAQNAVDVLAYCLYKFLGCTDE